MSRNYAQFTTAIWRPGDDFGNLTRNGQWVYFMLSTQPDISAAGTLSLNVRRWSGRCADGSKQDVIDGLQELSTHRFVFYDYDTEEVLLRGFIKADGGYGNRKRKPVIERAVRDVESPTLRKVLAEELAKVGLPAEWASDSPSDVHRMAYPLDGDEPPEATGRGQSDSTFPQVDSLSDTLSGTASDSTCRSDGVVVTQALVVDPQPSTRNPQPVPPPADSASAPSEQVAFEGMPEVPVVAETEEQTSWRLARAWEKRRQDARKPIIARGSKKKPDQVLMPLKNLIRGALIAKYTEGEVNAALEACNEGIPTGNRFDKVIADLRDAAAAEDPNNQGRAGSSLARRPMPDQVRRSTSALRAEQALSVADELDREYGHGLYAQEGTQ
jgi:hypothetical protein